MKPCGWTLRWLSGNSCHCMIQEAEWTGPQQACLKLMWLLQLPASQCLPFSSFCPQEGALSQTLNSDATLCSGDMKMIVIQTSVCLKIELCS